MDTDTKSYKYLALQDFDQEAPTGVLRYGEDGSIDQNDGTGWFPAQSQADMVFGGEPGTKDIDEQACNELLSSGKLKALKPETKQFIGRANGSE